MSDIIDDVTSAQDTYHAFLVQWNTFQKRAGGKTFLWRLIYHEIDRALNAENENESQSSESAKKQRKAPSFSSADIYEALGISTSATPFWESEDESVDGETIEYNQDWLGPKGNYAQIDNEYVEFGRKLWLYRARMEIAAIELIRLMRYGGAYGAEHKSDDVPDTPYTSTNEGDDDYNAFLDALETKTYEQRLITLAEATEQLAGTAVGRQFLAEQFEAGNQAVIDIEALFDPERIKTYDGATNALDENGKLNAPQVGTNPKRWEFTDEAKAIGNAMATLIPNLMPGLGYYYTTSDGDVSDDVAKYFGLFASKFVDDNDVWEAFANSSEFGTWPGNGLNDSDRLDDPNGNWNLDLAWKLGKFGGTKAINLTDTLAKTAKFGESPMSAQFTVSMSMFNISIASVAIAEGKGSTKDGLTIAKEAATITDEVFEKLDEMAAKAAREAGEEAAEEGAEEAAKEGMEAAISFAKRKPARFALKAIPIIADGVAMYMAMESAGAEYAAGDYSVAAGQALSAVSSGAGITAAFLGASEAMAASAGLGAFLLTPAGMAVAIAGVAAVAGILLITLTDDSDIKQWVRGTYFGAGWSNSKTAQPTTADSKNRLRWRYYDSNTGPNYEFQTSAYVSTYNPPRFKAAKIVDNPGGSDFDGSKDDPMGVLELGVTTPDMPGTDVPGDLFEDQYLYLRPIYEPKQANGVHIQKLLWKSDPPKVMHKWKHEVTTVDGTELVVRFDAQPHFTPSSSPKNMPKPESFRGYSYTPQPDGTYVDWIVTLCPNGNSPSKTDILGIPSDATKAYLEVMFVPKAVKKKLTQMEDRAVDKMPTLSRDIAGVSYHV